MTLAVSFWTDFNDQQQGELLLIGIVAAAVYSVLLMVSASAGNVGPGIVRALLWSAFALQLFVVSLTLYQAAALYYRRSPAGSDAERQGEAFDDWQFRARLGFVALYAVALAVSAGGGYALARGRGAVVAGGSLLGFMLFTSPFVEYTNTCEIGYGWADFPCT